MRIRTLLSIVWIHCKGFCQSLFNSNFQWRPYKVLIQITDHCNSKCGHCSIWKIQYRDPDFRKRELSLKNYQSFFQDYGKHILWLSLSGGEVSTYPEIDSLLALIKLHCPRLKILAFTTNALEIQKALRLAQAIQKFNWDPLITISLDGDQKLHDKIRGTPGNFDKALHLKSLLKENSIHANFGFTVINQNVEFLESSYSYWKKDIKAINSAYSDGIYGKKNLIDPELEKRALRKVLQHYQISNLGELVEYLFILLNYQFIHGLRKTTPLPCTVLESSLHITAEGKVHGCMFLPSLGSLKTERLSELMESPQWKQQKNQIKSGKCPQCWMNCYGPHSIMRYPLLTLRKALSIQKIRGLQP